MIFILDKLPKDAAPIGGGYFRIGSRTYVEADAIDYSTGEVKGRVYRDIRFEYHDPTPVKVPIHLKRAETTDQRIKRLMNQERSWMEWCKRVDEGIEDLDDFEFEDQPMFTSKYEDFIDLRREALNISDEDVKQKVKKSSDKSTDDVDKKSMMGHNKGPKLDDEKKSEDNSEDNS